MRQLVWSFIAALLVYGGWQFIRALCIRRQAEASLAESTEMLPGLDNDSSGYASPLHKEPPPLSVLPEAESIVRNIAPDNVSDPFALELELQCLRREVDRVWEAFETQRQEIHALRAEVERLTVRPEAPMTMPVEPPGVSPEYDEALALARRGVMADVIATRCGITRAEADLVASLAARARQQEARGRRI
ncbi:MAG: DUF2802 domain-containing protein [Azoarcus sp.]|nr:DUF2802 domain-containing protein [Azoarcus sp.]